MKIRRLFTVFLFLLMVCMVYAANRPSLAATGNCDTDGHSWGAVSVGYAKNDEETHFKLFKCSRCGATREDPEAHSWRIDYDAEDDGYEILDDQQHYVHQECSRCGEKRVIPEKHTFTSIEYELNDEKTHYLVRSCEYCHAIEKIPFSHNWEDSFINYSFVYEPYNNNYHYIYQECSSCGETRKKLEAHELYSPFYVKEATVNTPGIEKYECRSCNAIVTKTIPYTSNGYAAASYDLDHSKIYRTSKSVTVKLKRGLKGGVIKLKIGNKTYTKKLKTNTRKVKIKIKKPKYGKKIQLRLLYKGKVVGRDACVDCYWDRVWYAKKLRKGMTKTQAKYTWGPPNSTSSASGGYTYWNYAKGSFIRFKNGKVNYWYKVN